MAYDEERAVLDEDSDFSYNESNMVLQSNKKTSLSTFTDRIAKDLINSHNKVDKRMLKLHKIVETSYEKTDLINYLGVKDNLS